MAPTLLTFAILAYAFVAGMFGAVMGIGGAVLIIPGLTLLFGFGIKVSVGAALVSVIATSVGSGMFELRDRNIDFSLALLLTLATSGGAFIGAHFSSRIDPKPLLIGFSVIVLITGIAVLLPSRKTAEGVVTHLPLGFAMIGVTGFLTGLLGLGCGPIKVATLNRIMNLPLRAATATSLFVIGISSAISAQELFSNGMIVSTIAAPTALGALFGGWVGTPLGRRIPTKVIRVLLIICLFGSAFEMGKKAFS